MCMIIIVAIYFLFSEQATSEQLATENWALNLEICDFINSSEESAKDAAKAIRKRLSHSPKNYKVVMYTLVVSI